MDAADRARLMERMAGRGTAELESFFISVGLGPAFARPKEGWGRLKRINEALQEADREGRLEDVLRAAAVHFLGASASGRPPLSANRIRLELEELAQELDEWDGWKHADVAEAWQKRLNDALRNLRAHIGSDAPGDFKLVSRDYSASGKTINEEAFKRLRRACQSALKVVPGNTRQPQDSTSTKHLHPFIQRACKQLLLDGHYGEAILAACKALTNRVKDMTGSTLDGKKLMAAAFNPQHPMLSLNPGVTESHANEQEGFMHIFMGVMQ